MKIIPINDEVLIIPIKKNKTTGGILLPPTADDDSTMVGNVVSTGNGILLNDGRYAPLPVRAKDVVIYDRRTATVIAEDDNIFHFVKSGNIYGKLVKD